MLTDQTRQFFDNPLLDLIWGPRHTESVRTVEGSTILEIEAPGVKRESIEVTVEGVVLSIKGARRGSQVIQKYRLPEDIDTDQLSAKLEDGILTVFLPKRHVGSRSRRVEVT